VFRLGASVTEMDYGSLLQLWNIVQQKQQSPSSATKNPARCGCKI